MPTDPVEFTRLSATDARQRCGNRVRIEDGNSLIISATNPLQVSSVVASQPGDTLVHEPAVNIAAQIVMAAPGVGLHNVIGTIYWSLSGNPAAAVRMHIMEGGAPLLHAWHITVGGPGFMPFQPPRLFAANVAVTVHIAASGAGIFNILSIHGWTEA